jgi:hypothetical protein
MGTIGGNLAQEVRCWYYRYPDQIGGPLCACERVEDFVMPSPAITGITRFSGPQRWNPILVFLIVSEVPISPHIWPGSTVSVASVICSHNGTCTDARIALGAVAPAPIRVKAAEERLIGMEITEKTATEAAEAVVAGARPLNKNGYKIQITKALVKKAIMGGRHK